MKTSKKLRFALPALVAAAALVLTGCSNNDEGDSYTPYDISGVKVDDKAAALLPAKIKSSGKLVIGINAEYAPNEFKNGKGEIVGWAVDLVSAVSAKLGLEPSLQDEGFDLIIPKVNGGTMDLGSSSFTIRADRLESVDFVSYYEAGVLWAAPIGKQVDPDNACGLKVAVQATTFQHTDELPDKSKACEAAGKKAIEIKAYDTQAEATNAVAQGAVDAMTADSPITLFAISKRPDKIAASGKAFDVAPYGYAIPKKSELGEAVRAALQSLIDDGTYKKILEHAGVEDGGISKTEIVTAR